MIKEDLEQHNTLQPDYESLRGVKIVYIGTNDARYPIEQLQRIVRYKNNFELDLTLGDPLESLCAQLASVIKRNPNVVIAHTIDPQQTRNEIVAAQTLRRQGITVIVLTKSSYYRNTDRKLQQIPNRPLIENDLFYRAMQEMHFPIVIWDVVFPRDQILETLLSVCAKQTTT